MSETQLSREQQERAFFGWGEVDNTSWKSDGDGWLRRVAQVGSQADLEADITASHPVRKGWVICWKMLKFGARFGIPVALGAWVGWSVFFGLVLPAVQFVEAFA